MQDSVSPSQRFKWLLFFRFLSCALWSADVFAFFCLPVWAFLGCVAFHLWIVSRLFRWYLILLLDFQELSARIRADNSSR